MGDENKKNNMKIFLETFKKYLHKQINNNSLRTLTITKTTACAPITKNNIVCRMSDTASYGEILASYSGEQNCTSLVQNNPYGSGYTNSRIVFFSILNVFFRIILKWIFFEKIISKELLNLKLVIPHVIPKSFPLFTQVSKY